jgi:hypothetical protein
MMKEDECTTDKAHKECAVPHLKINYCNFHDVSLRWDFGVAVSSWLPRVTNTPGADCGRHQFTAESRFHVCLQLTEGAWSVCWCRVPLLIRTSRQKHSPNSLRET